MGIKYRRNAADLSVNWKILRHSQYDKHSVRHKPNLFQLAN